MKRIITNRLLYAVLLPAFLLFAGRVKAAAVPLYDHIALYGEAEYKPGFKNFSYVNPDAPKGGRIVMPDYGGFDSFNPFIFKGISPATAVGLTLDTLAVSPADDPSAAYPLLAENLNCRRTNPLSALSLTRKRVFMTERRLPPTTSSSVSTV